MVLNISEQIWTFVWPWTDLNNTEPLRKTKTQGYVSIKNAYLLLVSFITITFSMSAAPLILTQKDFPSHFAMVFLFCKTQLWEFLEVHFPSQNLLYNNGKDQHRFLLLSISFCTVLGVWSAHLTDKSIGWLLCLLLILPGHEVAEM